MKRTLSILAALVMFFSLILTNNNVFAMTEEDDLIKIRLTSVIKSNTEVKLSSSNGFSIYEMKDISDEIEYLDYDEIYVTIGDKNDIVLSDERGESIYSFDISDDLLISSEDRREKKVIVEDAEYRDYITFNVLKDKLIVINCIELEHYLYGVVPREMGATFETEALKAQSVAARTYTIKNINKHIRDGYNLCDSIDCQAYGGINVENDKTNEAVDETRGMIITYNGNPIDAVYHSSSGGHTDDAYLVWGGYVPYLIGVRDKFSIGFPNSRWELNMTSAEISNKLDARNIDVGKIVDLEILDTTSAGRVSEIKITGTRGEKVISGNELRNAIGTTILKSTLFTIDKESAYDRENRIFAIGGRRSDIVDIDLDDSYIIDKSGDVSSAKRANSIITKDGIINGNFKGEPISNEFAFRGKGYGHGLGMSQWGAQGMAIEGYDFEEILEFYYNDVRIEIMD